MQFTNTAIRRDLVGLIVQHMLEDESFLAEKLTRYFAGDMTSELLLKSIDHWAEMEQEKIVIANKEMEGLDGEWKGRDFEDPTNAGESI